MIMSYNKKLIMEMR